MDKSLEQYLSSLIGKAVNVSIVTNQDNLVVSYATGTVN
jgi:ABC-type phosphate/phosphonate transport system substrate-binding protein